MVLPKPSAKKVGDAPVFITFDIDFLDPAYAPGTGIPEGGGFTTWEAFEMIRKGLLGLNIKGCDLVCVNPTYDNAEITCMAAARVTSIISFVSIFVHPVHSNYLLLNIFKLFCFYSQF